MSLELLEQKLRTLPEDSFDEVDEFFDFILFRFEKECSQDDLNEETTAGLVTLEDILEEIVGEICDEDDMDEDEDVQRLKDGRYIVDPLMTLSDLSDELGIELEPPENSHVETLSGLIQATLGIIPSPGAEVKIQDYTFRVLKMDGTRMEKVMLILPPGKAGPKTQALKKI